MSKKIILDDQVEDFEGIEELTLLEAAQVAGGPIYAASFFAAVLTATKLGISIGEAIALLGGATGGGNGSVSYPAGGGGSDRRIKTHIKVEGEIVSLGVNAYSWEYKNAPGERFVGVMAQDLLARADLRSAVFKFADGPFAGFYGVKYAELGLVCLPIEAWDGEVSSLVVDNHVLV